MSQQTTQNKFVRVIRLFGDALTGEHNDYTTGSLRKSIFLLAIPMIIEMGMESVFALVDLFFVSKLGKHAVSTVGLTESVLTLIYSIAVGMSMAATAMVARRVGEKDKEGAAVAAMQSIWVGIGITILLSIAGVVFAEDILRIMGAEAETIQMGVPYTRIMMGSSIVIMLLFLINGIFRGAGDASIAMRSLIIANGCNIALCPILINGLGPIPAYGVTGAAMATAIGRSIGVLYQLYHLFNAKSVVQLTRASIKAEWDIIKSIFSIAWPATIQFIIASCSWIFLAKWVAETGGSEASAGYQTALRILMFFLLPAWGISNAAATLVGQSLGAQEPQRAEAAVMQTAKYNAIFMGIITLFFLLLPDVIVGLFPVKEDVKEIAVKALRIVSTGYVFYGVGMVMINAFNGAGDTRTPTVINVFGFWLFQVPLAFLLAKVLMWGPTGVFVAVPVAETLITIAAFVLFKKGKWKQIKI